MAAQLNVTTSVVDFLKSEGKPSDFASRRVLFEQQGLGSQAEFRGTAE